MLLLWFPLLNISQFSKSTYLVAILDLQVAKILLDCGVKVNVKNSDGLTALDISELQMQVDNREVKKLLNHAKASKASSVASSEDQKDYLRSKITFKERLVISVVRFKKNITNDTRNVLLVVAVLIATATYQAALSPPGGVWQDNMMCDNNSASNTTLNSEGCSTQQAGTVIMGANSFFFFLMFNTMALMITTLAIFVLLPSGLVSIILFSPLFLFVYCYLSATSVLSPQGTVPAYVNYILSVLVSMLFILTHAFFYVVYERLKRT